MGFWNIRSLLLAAFVLTNSISWTVSKHHYTHNVLGHRSRHRRQGAGLFLPSSYVIPEGEGHGPWGEWGEVSPCSRTCGGGVASQKRICLEVDPNGQPQCTGGDTKYFSCQTQDCPEGSKDFRSEQCSEYDNVPFRGVTYSKWVPFTKAPNPCKLTCMPHGERFYRPIKDVVDGTQCYEDYFDVCVNGVCQPVGCDMMLGSKVREDKCKVCGGNGTNCRTLSGVIDTQELTQGYNDILLIPKGATTIVIQEKAASNNYLAIRSKDTNEYYINGNYRISSPQNFLVAGTICRYERGQLGYAAVDAIKCSGPINETVYLSLLFLQETNVGIEYEYSTPPHLAPPPNQEYAWVYDEYSPCSATCGGGIQTRKVTCRTREPLEEVADKLCDINLKPAMNQTCANNPCQPRWVEGPWSKCSEPCGQGGNRSRQIHCEKIISQGQPTVVDNEECYQLHGQIPVYQRCDQNAACPSWFTGPWKPCDKLRGEGKQTRQVVCYQKIDGKVEVLADNACSGAKPPDVQTCILHPSEAVDWVVSDWSGCDNCLSKKRTRIAKCVTEFRDIVNSSFCAHHSTPILEEECDENELPACSFQWYATQWSNCSVECGKGVQNRRVFCGRFNGESVSKVDDDKCEGEEKYKDSKDCEIPEEKCPAKWFAGNWTACSEVCGTGVQFRKVMCLKQGVLAMSCKNDTRPENDQNCNVIPCDEYNARTTPMIDDDEDYDEDCEDEEEIDEPTNSDMMFSDSPFTTDEGSGRSTLFTESEPDFTSDTGSGSETSLETSSETDSTNTKFTETGSTKSSSDFDATEIITTESGITEETSSTSTESNSSGTTDENTSESSYATDMTDSSETTETGITGSASSETTETGTTEFDSSETTETDITDSSSSETDISDTTETSTTEFDGSETTETATTIFDSSETTETSTTELDSSETTETGITDFSSSETTETGFTGSDSSDTTETGSTESGSSETTETSTSESDSSETTETGTTESGSSETTETGITNSGSSETTETGITESGSSETTETGITESGSSETTETGITESGSSETTETGITESGSSKTTETGITESGSSETTETGITESGSSETSETSTAESVSSETTETGSTESDITGTTESGSDSTDTTESSTDTSNTGSTEEADSTSSESSSDTSETDVTGSTESTIIDSTATEGTDTEETSFTDDELITTWDWTTTVEEFTRRPKCKPRKVPLCKKSRFGCCPDGISLAAGPFEAGCDNYTTCNETKFGCCPDGLSPATGKNNKGCPIIQCKETLYGCCKSDNKTPAEGNNEEGCPPPPPACKSTKYGCCEDNKTEASGPKGKGCPENNPKTTPAPNECDESEFGCCFDNKTQATGPNEEGCPCSVTEFGCCFDNKTQATGPNNENCPCNATEFGCCPDGVSPALGKQMEGCVASCNTTEHGCCPDNETPAHGPEQEGCCLLTSFGCCPDNHKAAEGPHLEGCGCQYAHYGCCPDGKKIARGPRNEGCGCQYTQHGCCPDRYTEASGPDFEGCSCSTFQFGCCPDGITKSTGPGQSGCHCLRSKYGCCGDMQTAATGPNKEGCNCANSQFGCCPDGQSEAKGIKFFGCIDKPENKQAVCSLSSDRGTCSNNTLYYYYDANDGYCMGFWYSGCEGNGNKFATEEECKSVCVEPSPKESCMLPKIHGLCNYTETRWYYDHSSEDCYQFDYGGCYGNKNNFETREACQTQCKPRSNEEDTCTLPIENGSCAGSYERWGFNAQAGRCEMFVWGGCEGNTNIFLSEAACVQRCDPPGAQKPQCSEKQHVGNCTSKIPLWSFDGRENRCVPFYYTGCGGNSNKFNTEKECTQACPSTHVQDVCTKPASAGDCADYRIKWFYDTAYKRCRQFHYGGCGGNGNNFDTEQQCENSCSEKAVTTTTPSTPSRNQFAEDVCQLPMNTGPCKASIMMWFYDYASDSCSQFAYGGCEGNANRFESRDDCERRCRTPTDVLTPAPTRPTAPADLCRLPKSVGPCQASIESWFYDIYSDTCTRFIYGGCQGNDNRFESRDDCERRCRTPTDVLTPAPTRPTAPADLCRLPKSVGPCQASIESWFYDIYSDTCTRFIYGGCQGNDNRFESRDDCERRCRTPTDVLTPAPTRPTAPADLCRLPKSVGPCQASIESWFYDIYSDTCTRFIYGGCQGNDNRFDSRDDCERRCRSRPTTHTPLTTLAEVQVLQECQTPTSLEPCGDNITVFYYNAEQRTCLSSNFGRCRYANSYRTEEECERRCGSFRNIDVCATRVDPGPCRADIPKFYFDRDSGRCIGFGYGGCYGGANRFSTQEECEEVCGIPETDLCQLQPEPGNCLGAMERWYYDAKSDRCGRFYYSGCQGNKNRFRSQAECEARCARTAPRPTTTSIPPAQQSSEECRTPDSLTPCGDYVNVFYYNAEENKCLSGYFGGCRHPNSYRTEEECERKCGSFKNEDVCAAPVDAGPCRAAIPKYYFDRATGRCAEFAYGGCQGSANRFSTQDECEEVCGSAGPEAACLEPLSRGAACGGGGGGEGGGGGGALRRWFYSSDDADCRAFIYLGCQGTNNNFGSFQECSDRCVFGTGKTTTPAARPFNCSFFEQECATLRCEYGVQRMMIAENCEQCSCVIDDTRCAPYKEQCETLQCRYDMERVTGPDGCERCKCTEHPCDQVRCESGERCVATPYRDPTSHAVKYKGECKIMNKPGSCAAEQDIDNLAMSSCRRECNDDADCYSNDKCCARGCSQLCEPPTQPAPPTQPTPPTGPLPEQAPQPNMEAAKPEVSSAEGGKASLQCFFHGNPPPTITWRRGEITIDGSQGRYRILSDGTLEIVSLYRNDTGVYICVANNGLGTSTQQVNLQVTDPVNRTAGIAGEEGASETGELGQPLTLRCLVYGYPQPIINWYHGPDMVPFSNVLYDTTLDGHLLIRSLNLDTLGEYKCDAYNGQGRAASWNVVVRAWAPPGYNNYADNPYITERRSQVPRPNTGAPTAPPTTPSTTATPLVFTVPVKTRIMYESGTVAAGSELSLPCEVDGYPAPRVHWTKDGSTLSPSDRITITDARLTIAGLTENDSGEYGCHARNEYTSYDSTINIQVRGMTIPAQCTDNPFFADCHLIVKSKFCTHSYYSKFCCKSCVEAGQLNPSLLRFDETWQYRK